MLTVLACSWCFTEADAKAIKGLYNCYYYTLNMSLLLSVKVEEKRFNISISSRWFYKPLLLMCTRQTVFRDQEASVFKYFQPPCWLCSCLRTFSF